MKKGMTLLIMLAALLFAAFAAAESVVVDLVTDHDASFAFDESVPLMEVYFPMIHGADACFVRVGDETMMIDGATHGQRDLVAACAKAAGIDHVDIAVNTHQHLDHLPGMVDAAEYLPFGTFRMNCAEDADWNVKRAVKRLKELNVPIEHLTDGQTFALGGASVDVILRKGAQFTVNDTSAVLKITYGERTLLMAADIENRAQQALIDDPPACGLKVDILKYPHHGQTPMKKALADMIAPQATIITNNFYDGNPGAELFEKRGAPAFSTIYGVLRLRTDGKIWVVDYAPDTLRKQPPARTVAAPAA